VLVKPGDTYGEPSQGLLGDREAVRRDVIPEEVKATLDPPDERLVGMGGKPEGGERLVDLPDRRPQPPARRGEHDDVVHEARRVLPARRPFRNDAAPPLGVPLRARAAEQVRRRWRRRGAYGQGSR
jgi:hypothetical protein